MRCAVSRGAVGDDHLHVGVRLILQRIEASRQQVGAIQRRDNYGCERRPHSGLPPTRNNEPVTRTMSSGPACLTAESSAAAALATTDMSARGACDLARGSNS